MITQTQEPQMGRFSVEVELANNSDIHLAQAGHLPPEQVRRLTIRGVVDTGATRLVIPQSVATKLGLPLSGHVSVRYADGRTANRPVARDIHLSYGGRESDFNAVVEPGRDSPLIGAIVLEDLDFLADCVTGRLVPRDPNHIISEAE